MTREEAKDFLIGISYNLGNMSVEYLTEKDGEKMREAIKVLEQRTGRWINAKVGKLFPSNDFKCSECGNVLDFNGVNCGRGDANYCPNCGTKMEVKE